MIKKLFFVAFIFIIANVVAQTPFLKNFRIENVNKNRLYFDSSMPITGSNATGFKISGKTITGVTINSGQMTDHFFTVSSAFNFWDNNTIKYTGGSDIGIFIFDLQNVENNIPEPTSSGFIYASVSGGGNGSSPGSPTTLSSALSSVSAGETIYVLAGNYGSSQYTLSTSGTPTNPIKIIGYNATDGAGTKPNYNWDYVNDPLDATKMPLFSGTDPYGTTRGFQISADNVILKNIQSQNHQRPIHVNGAHSNIWIDNCNVYYGRDGFYCDNTSNSHIRITNSISHLCHVTAFRTYGDFVKYENLIATDDSKSGGDGNDYYLSTQGDNTIIRNSLIRRYGPTDHDGHGVSHKYGHHECLVENIDVVNLYLSVESWGSGATQTGNVYRNIHSWTTPDFVQGRYSDNNLWWGNTGGITQSSTASSNIFDGITVNGTTRTAVNMKSNNIYKNLVIYDSATYLALSGSDVTFVNCTFVGKGSSALTTGSGTNIRLINCIITGFGSQSGVSFSYCAFWNNGFSMPSGTGNITANPLFVNPANGDFHLQSGSTIKDSGTDSALIKYDKDGIERPNGKYSIGAYENATPSIGSVGPDVSICSGENTVLTASGGTSYAWNTGETTASITVSPSASTTYTVTISDGTNSDSHDVIVTVNEAPSVNVGSDQTICSGEEVILTANGVGNFLWSTGETSSTITVSPTSTTTYTVTASNSCADDATDQVIVNVTPGVNLTLGSDVEICLGEIITLTAQSNGDFLWNTGETTASITVSPASTTIYSVTSSLGDCSKTEEVSVTVNQAPSVNAGSDQTICSGEEVILTANGVGNFLWSTGETTSTITVSPTSTTTYTVTASNSCTDDATDQIIVNVTPGVNLTVGNDVEICLGESITLTAQSNGNFLWNTGETTASITVSPASTTIYSVTSSLGDCSKTEEVSVTVNQAPSVNAGSDQTICSGEEVILTANGVGNFLWSTGETTSSITVSPTSTTTYTVTASNSCADDVTDQIIVSVNDKPTLSVSNDITIENGSSTVLTATGDGNFLWSTGETTSSITVSPTTTSTYNVSLTSSQGCSDEDNVVVTVQNSGSSVTADAGADIETCLDANITLTATGGDSYLWSTGETTPSITVNPTETTTYTVTVSNGYSIDVDDVTIYVDANCSEIANRPIIQEFKVYPNPTNGILHIELSGYNNELNISLFNATGKIIHSEIISNYSLDKSLKRNINLRKFGKGVYYARIANNGKNDTKKVIVM